MKSDRFLGNNGRAGLTILVIIIFLMGGCALANHPPVITNLKAEPEAVFPSGVCQIECVALDEDGDELSYEWLASESYIDGDGAIVTWGAPESEGIYNIMVKVTDGNGGEVTDSITITVRVNRPPAITSLKADMDWVIPSSSCRIECNAEDPDGDKLSYEWSANAGVISGTDPVVSWTAPDAAGLYNITVVVTDGQGGEDTRSLTISVALNPPPIIEDLIVIPEEPELVKEYPGRYIILEGISCEIKCVVTDANDELVYEWLASGDKTDGGEISGEGPVVTWTAPDVTDAGFVIDKVTITVVVSDADGNMAGESMVFTVETCADCF